MAIFIIYAEERFNTHGLTMAGLSKSIPIPLTIAGLELSVGIVVMSAFEYKAHGFLCSFLILLPVIGCVDAEQHMVVRLPSLNLRFDIICPSAVRFPQLQTSRPTACD